MIKTLTTSLVLSTLVLAGCHSDESPQTSAPEATEKSTNISAKPTTSSSALSSTEQAQQWIDYLASDDMNGRKTGSAEMPIVQAWLEETYKTIGIQPLPGYDSYRQEFTATDEQLPAANIVGYLPCNCDNDRYIVVGAHYDHVGTDDSLEGDTIYNGADDDASGVVATLIMAQSLAQAESLPFNVIIGAWDAEEMGLLGSTYFVDNPMVELSKIETGFMFELVGVPVDGKLNSAWMTGHQYSELFPVLQEALKAQNWELSENPFPQLGLFMRSDNAPFSLMSMTKELAQKVFRDKVKVEMTGVPVHAISVWRGQDHYHKVHDEADLIDASNLASLANALAEVVKNMDPNLSIRWLENEQFDFKRPTAQ